MKTKWRLLFKITVLNLVVGLLSQCVHTEEGLEANNEDLWTFCDPDASQLILTMETKCEYIKHIYNKIFDKLNLQGIDVKKSRGFSSFSFALDFKGHIHDISIDKSNLGQAVDQKIIEAIKASGPLPAFPENVNKRRIDVYGKFYHH